jgi:hypothetical protein
VADNWSETKRHMKDVIPFLDVMRQIIRRWNREHGEFVWWCRHRNQRQNGNRSETEWGTNVLLSHQNRAQNHAWVAGSRRPGYYLSL